MELLVIILVSFVVMTLAVLGMASGILLGRSAIRGSCGGLNKGACACSAPCERKKRALLEANKSADQTSQA